MLYIRTDINEIIATGHVMRCLSIADAAKEIGEDVTFIFADEQGKNYIENRGYQTIILHTQWNDMQSELSQLKDIIEQEQITSLLVDSYQVTERYLKTLSSYVKVIYIDDWGQDVYPVDALICYMSHWEKLEHKTRYSNTKLLLGLEYVPIRTAFQNAERKEIRDKVESVLLLSGGSDPYNVLSELLSFIRTIPFNEIVVICGKYNTNADALMEEYKDDANVWILKSVNNIEDYMKKADLAISAGGTTLYELCACGTPAISYAFADNQIENVKGFAQNDIIEYAGDVRYDDVFGTLNEIVKSYCENIEVRKQHSQRMQAMVDGKGARRIVAEWMELIKE